MLYITSQYNSLKNYFGDDRKAIQSDIARQIVWRPNMLDEDEQILRFQICTGTIKMMRRI